MRPLAGMSALVTGGGSAAVAESAGPGVHAVAGT